jgi:hypothetical protein
MEGEIYLRQFREIWGNSGEISVYELVCHVWSEPRRNSAQIAEMNSPRTEFAQVCSQGFGKSDEILWRLCIVVWLILKGCSVMR